MGERATSTTFSKLQKIAENGSFVQIEKNLSKNTLISIQNED